MKEIHDKLITLLEDMRSLTYAVGRHNPGIEADDKETLPAIAATMRSLGDQFDCLGIETLAVHDERQMKKHLEEKE